MQKGNKYIKKTEGGRILVAFVLTSEPEHEFNIQMVKENGEKFFIRKERLLKHWYDASVGVQLKFIK